MGGGQNEVSCLSWKWKERSSVKIAERTYEEGKKALHRRRESGHSEAASFDMLAGRQQEIHAERDQKLAAARHQRQIRRQQAA
jgi:hypothetical protein